MIGSHTLLGFLSSVLFTSTLSTEKNGHGDRVATFRRDIPFILLGVSLSSENAITNDPSSLLSICSSISSLDIDDVLFAIVVIVVVVAVVVMGAVVVVSIVSVVVVETVVGDDVSRVSFRSFITVSFVEIVEDAVSSVVAFNILPFQALSISLISVSILVPFDADFVVAFDSVANHSSSTSFSSISKIVSFNVRVISVVFNSTMSAAVL